MDEASTSLDVFRYAIALGGVVIALLSLRVALVRTRARRTDEDVTGGALGPLVLAGFALIASFDQLERLHEPVTWRLPAYAVVVTLGIVALVGSFLRGREFGRAR